MPGLLDARGGFDDPITMGLLGASQALLTPMSQGGGLGAAFGAFPAAQQAAEQRRMRELMLQAQMGNMQSETEYRNAQMEASRQKAMRDAQIEAGRNSVYEQIALQNMPTFRDASAAITGVSPTADYVAPQNRRLSLTPQLAAQAARFGIKPEELTAVFDAGRPEVARTIESLSANGLPQTVQYDKFGQPVGTGINKPFEFRNVDVGDKVQSVNPYLPYLLTKGMTPGEVASNQVAMANLGVSRERLALDAARGRAPSGYRENPDGSLSFIPGGPADPATKLNNGQPSEDERKAAGWLAQADNAYKNMLSVIATSPNAAKPGFPDAVAGTPLIGPGAAQMMRSPERQQFLQAASSLSEALLRAATGAGVNESEARQKIAELVPQIGDKEPVRKQKMEAIPIYLASLNTRAGRAAPNGYAVPAVPNAGGAPASGQGAGAEQKTPNDGPKTDQKVTNWNSVLLTARNTGKTPEQVRKDLIADGWTIR